MLLLAKGRLRLGRREGSCASFLLTLSGPLLLGMMQRALPWHYYHSCCTCVFVFVWGRGTFILSRFCPNCVERGGKQPTAKHQHHHALTSMPLATLTLTHVLSYTHIQYTEHSLVPLLVSGQRRPACLECCVLCPPSRSPTTTPHRRTLLLASTRPPSLSLSLSLSLSHHPPRHDTHATAEPC